MTTDANNADPNDQPTPVTADSPTSSETGEKLSALQLNSSDVPPSPLNPLSLLALRANPDTEEVSVKIPGLPKIVKPGKQTWFQTLADETQWHAYYQFVPEGEFGGVVYLVAPQIAGDLGSLANRVRLIPYVTLEQEVNFWPLKMPERPNSWSDSALEIAGEARTKWRRMIPDARLGGYKVYGMREEKPAPSWPQPEGIQALLERAVAGRVISSMDHPEIAKLF